MGSKCKLIIKKGEKKSGKKNLNTPPNFFHRKSRQLNLLNMQICENGIYDHFERLWQRSLRQNHLELHSLTTINDVFFCLIKRIKVRLEEFKPRLAVNYYSLESKL